jgi:SNF2 family DNA or RNA helicase
MKLRVKANRFLFEDLPFERKDEARDVGAHYSTAREIWQCPANIISAVGIMSVSKDNGYDDNLEELYIWMESVFNAKRQALKGLTPNGQEIVLKNPAMPHQDLGYKRAIWQKKLGAWWEPGTGKSYLSLAVAQHLWTIEKKGRVLIFCPLSLVSTWQDEMKLHLSCPYKVYECIGTKRKKEKIVEAWKMSGIGNLIFLIVTWDTSKAIINEMAGTKIDLCIGDETGFIKNHAAQRTKASIEIADNAEYKLALNGTPYISDVRDLWSQMRFLSEEYAGNSYWRFVNRYVEFDNSPWNRPVGLRPEMKQELKRLLDVVGMSVKKEDVLKDLPPKSYQVRWVEAKGEQKSALQKAMNDFEIAVSAYKKGSDTKTEEMIAIKNAMARAGKVQQISSGWTKNEGGEIIRFEENPKRDAIVDLAQEGDGKVVLFSRFIEDLEIMYEALEKIGRKPVIYSGRLKHKDAEAAKYSFTHGESDFFLSQVQKGGFGLNLQMSHLASYVTNWWSYGVRIQSEARLHRKGQKNAVLYVDVMMKGSMDEKIQESFKRGTNVVSYLFGTKWNDKELGELFKMPGEVS